MKKLAIVCDFLVEIGGAESVLRAVHELYPTAPIYTSVYRHNVDFFFDQKLDVKTGKLNKYPAKLRRLLSPRRQKYFNNLDLSEYDVVLSITGAEAKGTMAKKHICYCHVPTQYYWGKYQEYLKNPGFGLLDPLARLALKTNIKRLRRRDLEAASHPTKYLTDSTYAADEIEKYYHKTAKVIYPPVRTKIFKGVVKARAEQIENLKQEIERNKSQAKSSKYNNIKSTTKQTRLNHYNITKSQELQIQKSEQQIRTIPQSVENFVPKLMLFKKHYAKTSLAAQVQNIVGDSFYLDYSRQVTWKRIDILIEAAIKANQPLVLVGDGPEHKNLVKLAKKLQPTVRPEIYLTKKLKRSSSLAKNQKNETIEKIGLVTFVSAQPQERLAELLAGARAFLFASLEPFGIAPVEALAAGCPVIAFGEGGAVDYVRPDKNGLLFPLQTAGSLAAVINDFEKLREDPKSFIYNPATISKSADQFSETNFKRNIKKVIDAELGK